MRDTTHSAIAHRLPGWAQPPVLAAAALAGAAGFAQFGVTAALADVAAAFGRPTSGESVAAQVGLAGATLGLGLAVIRLASLGSLFVAGVADRLGRRRVLVGSAALGLALTAAAGLTPTFWWFVAIFALGRPLLSATNAIAAVVAAEETRTADRSAAIAVIAAAYALGGGALTLIRGLAIEVLGFRGVFLLALVPLALLPLLVRVIREPRAFVQAEPSAATSKRAPVLAHVPPGLRGRLALLCTLHLAVGFVTGPTTSYLFAYGESVVGLPPLSMTAVVGAAGIGGLFGLLGGRWSADRVGRRPTAGIAMAASAGGAALTYVGTAPALVVGYIASLTAAAAYAPAAGALDAEAFPTSMRATAAGWITASQVIGATIGLVVFGLLADSLGFTGAALLISIPVLGASVGYARLPETRGVELT